MLKRGAIQLSTNFIVILILSVAALAIGVVFIDRIHSSSSGIAEHIDAQTKQELLRLRNAGRSVALAPAIVRERGVAALMIANDGSVGSNEFGFRVSFNSAFASDRSEITIDPDIVNSWIARPGSESTVYEIEPHESMEFLIAVNPAGNPPRGMYIFNVDVRYDEDGDGSIAYASSPFVPEDGKYKSLMKLYVRI